MKKIVLIFILLFTYNSYSQIFVDDVNINEKAEYIQLYIFHAKKIYIDYGQKPNFLRKQTFKNKDSLIFTPTGSKMATINFITNNGYEYVEAIVQDISDVKYIFKRKSESKE